MARLDRVLRTVVLVPVFALGASLAILIVSWILLHTPVGQEEIREFLEEQLQAQLGEGTARIGGADFSLSGKLTLTDISIELDGDVPVAVDELRVEVELFSFLRGELRIPSVHVVRPRVDARVDLARLAPPPEPADTGGGLSVSLGDLLVDDATVLADGVTIDRGTLDAELHLAQRMVRIDAASAHWVERDRTAEVSGIVREVDGAWVTRSAKARVAGIEATVEAGLFAPATGEAAAAGTVTAAAADVLAIGGEWLPPEAAKWRGDLALELTAARASTSAPWDVSAAGTIGSADAAAVGRTDGAAVAGRVRAVGVEPAALYDGAPEGRIDAKVTVADSEATLLARGRVEDFDIAKLEARAQGTLRGGFVEADLTDGRGVIHAEARARRVEHDAILIEESHLHGDVTDVIARFDAPRMRQLRVDLHAVGLTTDMRVFGEANVIGLREDETRVAAASVVVSVPHVSIEAPDRRLAGTLDVKARGVDLSGRGIGSVRAKGRFSDNAGHLDIDVTARELGFADVARGDVVIDRDAHSTRVALGEVWISTDTLTWEGDGGQLTIFDSGRVDIRGVTLESPAGRVGVDGVLDAPRARRAEGKLLVKLEDLDLAAAGPTFASVLNMRHPLRGRVKADVELARRGRAFETTARADFAGLVWREGAAAANGFVRGKLGGGKVVAEVEVRPRKGDGLVRLQVEADAPRNTLDANAWRRLDLKDIARSELDIEDIDSAVVEAFAGDVLPGDGAVQGTIVFPHEGKQAFFIDIDVTDVTTPWFDAGGAEIEWLWDAKALSGRTEVTYRGDTLITGDVGLDRGFQQLWRRPLRDFLTARVTVDGEVRSFDLSRLERAGIVTESLSGQLDGDIDVSGTIERPRIVVSNGRASNVRAAGIQISQIKLNGDYEGRVVNATVSARQSAGGSLTVSGGYGWDRADSMTATVKATSFDLRPLRMLAPDDTHPLSNIAGRLDAKVTAKGSPSQPDVRGVASVHRAEVLLEGGQRRIDRGDVRLQFKGDHAVVEQLAGYSGDGKIDATGSVKFKDWEFALDVVSTKFPLTIAAYVISIDAKGTFKGSWVDGGWKTRADVSEALVVLADTGRALQDIGPLEDVIFVERIGGRRTTEGGDVASDAMPFEVVIVTTDPIHVKSKEANAWITASVTLRYRGVLTWLQGIVEVDRGTVTLFERAYQIARGIAKLDGPMPIDPDLDIELRRQFPAALVSVIVSDRLSDPRIQFASDPADYDDTQILQIILGQNPDEVDDASLTPEQRAGAAIGNVVAGKVVRDTLKVPVDVIRTHPDGLEFGKFFFDGTVLVGYRSRNSGQADKNANEGTIEWRLRRNVVVEGFYGDNSIGAADILYIIRF